MIIDLHCCLQNTLAIGIIFLLFTISFQNKKKCKPTFRITQKEHVVQNVGNNTCHSIRKYRLKFCSTCARDRCCYPWKTSTRMLEFVCSDKSYKYLKYSWTKRCKCEKECPKPTFLKKWYWFLRVISRQSEKYIYKKLFLFWQRNTYIFLYFCTNMANFEEDWTCLKWKSHEIKIGIPLYFLPVIHDMNSADWFNYWFIIFVRICIHVHTGSLIILKLSKSP